MIKRETYMRRIRPFIGSELVKVMTGIRRCGKSVMLELIKEELKNSSVPEANIISINFEDMRYAHLLTAKALHDEIIMRAQNISGKVYLFFDEIQEVADWEKCINSFRVEFDCDIYITGSNAKLLSGELATNLGGRYVEFTIYPFSFSEFTELYKVIFPGAQPQECFQKYLLFGGMPYLANLRYAEEPCRQYLTDVFNSVQLKDIVKRNKIRDVDLLERILSYIIANVGTTFSATSISKFFKSEKRNVAPETILNYIRHCTEAVFGGNIRDINLILENIVFMELLRRGYNVTVGKTGNLEIDFIAEKHGEKIYVQVCYLLASQETIEREFGVYDNVNDNFPKYVVSLDEFDMSRNGIKHCNIRNFLTKETFA